MSPGIDLTAFDGDVTSLFGELTDTSKGITDVPSKGRLGGVRLSSDARRCCRVWPSARVSL